MKPRFEKVLPRHGHSFAWLEFREPVFDCPYHFHPEIELTLILESHGTAMIGSGIRAFSPGDVFLIGENTPHAFFNSPRWRSTRKHARSQVIQFRRDCFGAGFFELPELRRISRLVEAARKGIVFGPRSRVELARKITALADTNEAGRVARLLELLQEAASLSPKQWQSVVADGPLPVTSANDAQRMQRVLDFIQANLTRELFIEEAAKVACLSPASFSRFFRRATKRTFVKFVNAMRVNLACEHLAATQRSVTDIAFATGFGNLSNFNRRFREVMLRTPSDFRQDCARVVGAHDK